MASGSTVSVASLACLLTDALVRFESIQLGQMNGRDLEMGLLTLDHTRLRLSRWGKAVGLSDSPLDYSIWDNAGRTETVAMRLTFIIAIIDRTKEQTGVEMNYAMEKGTRSDDVNVMILSASTMSLHEGMERLSLSRTPGLSGQARRTDSKPKWFINTMTTLKALLDEVANEIDQVVDLFPALQTQQHTLVAEELALLGNEDTLRMLEVAFRWW